MKIKQVGDPVRPSLRIAVLGVGGIGSTFAFKLARSGLHEVTAIARPGSVRLQQLQRDGGIVNIKGERAQLRVADALDEEIPYDLVLVTLQAQQVEAVLPGLQRSAAKWIQFMSNQFDPERLRDAVGPDRCSFGMPFVQATVDFNGVSRTGRYTARERTSRYTTCFSEQDYAMRPLREPSSLEKRRC